MENTAINIGLHVNQKVIDLRVPNQVSMDRLKLIVEECLNTLGEPFPKPWELQLLHKNLKLDSKNSLSAHALGDGEQFKVVGLEKGE
jgi:uncharacterized ubiquitin-like protein YukD